MDPDTLLQALDPEQRLVATTLSGPVAVIAGAGTGKTRAITHRIAHGVHAGVYQPTAVLAVTFTTRAAGEMRGRLQQLGVPGVQARTFHSAALRQVQYFWPRVHGSLLPEILANRMGLVAEAASRLRVPVDTGVLRDLVGEISWAKVSNVGPADYPARAEALNRGLASVAPEVVARVFETYEEAKRDRDRIDFEDILLCATALLSDHPDVADQVRQTYRHLVVDEYQDVSPLQEALVTLWLGERRDLCVVGDPAQTIHSFAGARADYLTGFARRHPDATVIRLVRDYRSTPQVVEVANRIMRTAGRDGAGSASTTAVTLQAQRPSGPEPEFTEAADEPTEAAAVADWLAARHAAGVDYREMAVLFRINAQSPSFEQALADRDIPYLVRGAERFYERPEVRQALGALTAATRSEAVGEGSAVDEVRAVLSSLGWTTEAPTGGGQRRERWESLAALVSVAEDLVATDEYTTLHAVVGELQRRADAQHAPIARGVTLATIHSAKGLEWDAVAVAGVHEGTLPFILATKAEEIAEERRLLYVAVTRAREHLHISWSRGRSGDGRRRASRFLDGVRPDAAPVSQAGGRRAARQRSAQAAQCRVCGHRLNNGAERKLGRHEDCPSTFDENLLAELKDWRRDQAREQKLPAYCIVTDATLMALAEQLPRDEAGLSTISGIGPAKLQKYGADLLEILGRD
ncbi:MAG TPA: ATP-dependent DNA helicase UvrD2 [Propionibacterium sp.]|nr:ATP-dependent DNA helicase UvrD2 [Propionibacterium sp.]